MNRLGDTRPARQAGPSPPAPAGTASPTPPPNAVRTSARSTDFHDVHCIHSMLVYEPGQFFLAHQDSEKDDAMIATLVVTLPSAHTGGELAIEHSGEATTYQGSKSALSERLRIRIGLWHRGWDDDEEDDDDDWDDEGGSPAGSGWLPGRRGGTWQGGSHAPASAPAAAARS